MAISTYTELQTAVLGWNWGRNTAYVADAIRLAHSNINLALRGSPLLQTTADLTINSYRIAAPSDFQSVSRLWLDDSYDTPLSPLPPERIAYEKAKYDSGQRPMFYGIEGNGQASGEYFVFAPDPGATTYTGKLLYTARLTVLSSGSDTNLVLTRWPNAYLYGALAEMSRFEDDDARLAKYQPLFDRTLAEITQVTRSDAMAGGAMEPHSPYVV